MDDENDLERFYCETSPHEFFDWLVKDNRQIDEMLKNQGEVDV